MRGITIRTAIALLMSTSACGLSVIRTPIRPACIAARTHRNGLVCSESELPAHAIKAPRRLKSGEAPRNSDKQDRGRRNNRRGGSGANRAEVRAQGKASQVRSLQRLAITGGTAKGRRIVTPEVYLRPMMSRVREALFSILYPTNVLRASASHLDLFAGAGTVGLEALSRGVGTGASPEPCGLGRRSLPALPSCRFPFRAALCSSWLAFALS